MPFTNFTLSILEYFVSFVIVCFIKEYKIQNLAFLVLVGAVSFKQTSKNPANTYLFKVNNKNTRKRCKICSKLIIKTQERRQWHRSGVFIVTFEHISLFSVSIFDFEQVNITWVLRLVIAFMAIQSSNLSVDIITLFINHRTFTKIWYSVKKVAKPWFTKILKATPKIKDLIR